MRLNTYNKQKAHPVEKTWEKPYWVYMDNIYKILKESFLPLIEEEKGLTLRAMQGDVNSSHPNGFLRGKLDEKDPHLFEVIIPIIKHNETNPEFQKDILQLFQKQHEAAISQAKLKASTAASHGDDDYVSRSKIQAYEKLIANLTFGKVMNYYEDLFDSLTTYGCRVYKDHVTRKIYCLFGITELFFEHIKESSKNRFPERKGSVLERFYESKGIFLNDLDPQYKKYGLLTAGDRFELSTTNALVLKDIKLGAHIFLNDARVETLRILESLQKMGDIRNLALLPDYTIAGDNIPNISPMMEGVEFGKIFSLSEVQAVPATKLYDLGAPHDALWVKVDCQNITFEEILDNFDTHGDSIVTQVVHLEYFKDEGSLYIKHIDHEYIFYSISEFEARLYNKDKKGTNKTRIKTFKVDDSRIPLYLEDGSFFLYRILSEYFQKTELLAEYFEVALSK